MLSLLRLNMKKNYTLGKNKCFTECSLALLIVLCLLPTQSLANPKSFVDFSRLADAIFWAEGGWTKTRYPYGIKQAGRKHTEVSARVVCLNTLRNSYRVWDPQKRVEFITHLSRTYCPPSVDPVGNKNWRKNVDYFYRNPKKLRP